MAQRDRIITVKHQTPKKVTLPNVEHFMQIINEQLVQTYQGTYVSSNRIDKELHIEEDDVAEDNKVEEDLKTHLVN